MLLDYLAKMDMLASDNPTMAGQLAHTGHFTLKDAALSWWQSLAPDIIRYAQTDWVCFIYMYIIHQHFITPRWMRDRCEEYADMVFQQSGHTKTILPTSHSLLPTIKFIRTCRTVDESRLCASHSPSGMACLLCK